MFVIYSKRNSLSTYADEILVKGALITKNLCNSFLNSLAICSNFGSQKLIKELAQ